MNAKAALLQVKLGPSFLIPNSQIGTFASVTAFKSMVRSRRDMFDVAAAGPIAGGITAAALLLAGIALSSYTDEASRVRPADVYHGCSDGRCQRMLLAPPSS